MSAESLSLSLLLAFLLDLWWGDPAWTPHPVRWMGKAILWSEPRFRALPVGPRTAGALMAALLVALTWGLSLAVVHGSEAVSQGLGFVVRTILLYTCLSVRGLYDAALAVGRAIERAGLIAARKAVSLIVGREVSQLDEREVSRAAVESVAENLVDGFVSPLFFVAIGGVPLAMAYKMVNTLDSMIGYKNDRYLDFGRFAARMDDVANFLPARLVVPFVALAAQWLAGRGKESFCTAWRDGSQHDSPNAGYPEASFAGALNLWLGGPNRYHGQLVDKPVIGSSMEQARPMHIRRACRLLVVVATLMLTAAVGLLLCCGRMGQL